MLRKNTLTILSLVLLILGTACWSLAATVTINTGESQTISAITGNPAFSDVILNGGTLNFDISGGEQKLPISALATITANAVEGNTINVSASNTIIEAAFLGTGVISKTGTSHLMLGGANDNFAGTFKVTGGNSFVGVFGTSASSAKAVWNASDSGSFFLCLPDASDTGYFEMGDLIGNGTVRPRNTNAATAKLKVGAIGNDSTFSGIIRGESGKVLSLTKTGTGTWTLTGDNSYTEGTTIEQGTLQIGNGGTTGTTGTGNVNILAGANFVVNRSNAASLNGAVYGAGNFSTIGGGTTTLTGQYTVAGTTNVGAGSLVFKNTSTLSGTLMGSGKIVADTTDLRVLEITSSANTSGFSGTMEIASGTLKVATGKLGGTTGVLISDGTFSTIGGSSNAAFTFGTTGTHIIRVESGNFILTNKLGNGDFTKTGGGQLHLQGDNSNYTGTITVNNEYNSWIGFYEASSSMPKATIAFGAGENPQGIVFFPKSNPTYKFGMITSESTAVQIRSTTNNDDYGNFTLEVGDSTNGTFAGIITNATSMGGSSRIASVVKTGTGTWTLTGNNTYTGTTTVSQGTLQIGNGGTTGNLSANTNVILASEGTLAFNRNANYGPTLASLTSNGGTIANRTSNDVYFDKTISGSAVTIDAGSGKIALKNNLAATAVTIQSGILRIGYQDIGGNITSSTINIKDGAVLEVRNMNNSGAVLSSGTISAAISGTGTIRHVDNVQNTLTLNGNNNGFTGKLEIQGGSVNLTPSGLGGTSNIDLSGGKLTFNGSVVSNASMKVSNEVEISVNPGGSAGNVQFNGGLTGSGTLTKTGVDHLILGGDHSGFNGTIQWSNGWVGLSGTSAGSKNATYTMSSTANMFLELKDGGTISMGDLTGGLNIVSSVVRPRDGSKNMTLSVGWLGKDSSFASNLVNQGTIILGLEKAGAGTWTLLGTSNSYTGATTVSDGMLRVDGAITQSAVTVNDGAAIAGSGRIGKSLTLNDGAAFFVDLNTWVDNPATTPLSVNSLTFAEGSTIQFVLDDPMLLHGSPAIDFLDVTTLTGLESVILDFSQAGGNGIWNYGMTETGEFWAQINTAAAPEPGTWTLLLLGLGMLLRRKK